MPEDISNSSTALLMLNTSALNSEELSNYITLSEEINARNVNQYQRNTTLAKAQLTREEVFECSNMDDDMFLSALEHQNSFMANTQVTDLDITQSVESILKYFDEDVEEFRSSSNSTPTKQHIGNRVMKAVKRASSPFKKHNKKGEKSTSVKALKAKYEPVEQCAAAVSKKPNKTFGMQNVKQMAQMFNNKISHLMNVGSNIENKNYAQLKNEFSPEPMKTIPKEILAKTCDKTKPNLAIYRHRMGSPRASPNLRRKQQNENKENKSEACLVTEEIFRKLSVKDKAQLYQKFIEDMLHENSDFKTHVQKLNESVQKELKEGVIIEKQEPVKQLAREIEAKLGVPRQTMSEGAIKQASQYSTPSKKGKAPMPTPRYSLKAAEAEDVISSMYAQVVKPSKQQVAQKSTKAKQLAKTTKADMKEIVAMEPSVKRRNNMIRMTYSTEPYAPPKKIRRTRDERLAPKQVFQNAKIETMFYAWFKEKSDASDDEKEVIANPDDVKNKNTKLIDEGEMKLPVADIPKTKERSSSESSVKTSEMEESESCLSSMPKVNGLIAQSLKTNDIYKFSHQKQISSDESQPEQKERTLQSKDDFKFLKPIKPLRKKKLQRTLAWKKENSIVESAAVPCATTTTDSDSDSKAIETKKKLQTFNMQKAMKKCNHQLKKLIFTGSTTDKTEHNKTDADKSVVQVINSPRKIKSAYTLTVLTSPSPYTESDQSEADKARIARETSRSLPSVLSAIENEMNQLNISECSSKLCRNTESKSMVDSYIDQGFETGSTELDSASKMSQNMTTQHNKSKSPLFIKLTTPQRKRDSGDSACESNSNCSTPFISSPLVINEQNCSPVLPPPKPRRRIFNETDSRRNSIAAMQVIREDHPLETRRSSLGTTAYGEEFTEAKLPQDANVDGKTSSFWISAGDFTTSLPIHYNAPDRLRLLLDIFCQKSYDAQDWHFGIDDHKFTIKSSTDQEEITKRLPKIKNTSHYWFSAGDLAVPFNGKYMRPEKIKRLFKFIRECLADENETRLRFGVDIYEFSQVADNCPKLSLDSNFSMLLRLQGGSADIQHFDDRSAWPKNVTYNTYRASDLEQSELDVYNSDSSRLSISPLSCNSMELNSPFNSGRTSEAGSPFRFSFANEALDQLFESSRPNAKILKQSKDLTVDEMLNKLQQQEHKLNDLEQRIRKYSGIEENNQLMDQCKNMPEYMNRLRRVVKTIEKLGHGNGFEACSLEQLEACMCLLSRYADICLNTCDEQMSKVLDAVLLKS